MAEPTTNGEYLTRIIGGYSDDFRDAAAYTGNSALGHFTAYVRAYHLRDVQVPNGTVYDESFGDYVTAHVTQQRPRLPYDAWDAEQAHLRPENEIGIEVVAQFEDLQDPRNYRFEVTSATAVAVNWVQRGPYAYGVDSAELRPIELTGQELLSDNRLSISHGTYLHHYAHFVGPYVADTLARKLTDDELPTESAAQNLEDAAFVQLGDAQGNTVALQQVDGQLVGMFYPADGDPIVAYWNGGGLSMMDRMNHARWSLPGERPFFNFTAGITSDAFNRGGYVHFANNDHSTGVAYRLKRHFAAIVDGLQPIDSI